MNIFSLHDWVEFGYNEWKNLAGTAENSKQRNRGIVWSFSRVRNKEWRHHFGL